MDVSQSFEMYLADDFVTVKPAGCKKTKSDLYLKQTVCPLNYGKWILLEIGLDQGHEELEDNQMMLI